MESSWPENLPSDRQKAIDELVRGREVANKLKIVLNNPIEGEEPICAEDLVTKILTSFANTLSILNVVDSDEVSQFPEASRKTGRRSSEDSGDSTKSISTVKDRRGCYKRRKTSQSWTKETSTLVDDGHQWRKYGQKAILNSKYPRHYFRCTHKYDQGCLATKQVQQIQDDPQLHRTTYYGHHTCKNLLNSTQLFLDSADDDSSMLLSFGNNNNNNLTAKQDPFLPSFQIKQEYNTKDYDNITNPNNQSSSSNYFTLSPDPDHQHLLSGPFDHGGEVISGVNSSCTTSSHSLDIGLDIGMMRSVEFEDDVLQFEFN